MKLGHKTDVGGTFSACNCYRHIRIPIELSYNRPCRPSDNIYLKDIYEQRTIYNQLLRGRLQKYLICVPGI